MAEVQSVKTRVLGLKQAADLMQSVNVSLPGFSHHELNALHATSNDQYTELVRYESTLAMKLTLLQRSMDLMLANLTSIGFPNIERQLIFTNHAGTAFLMANGSVGYIGYRDASNGFQGSEPGYDTSQRVLSEPVLVDLSPLQGTPVIGILPISSGFYVWTAKNEFWGWGSNPGNAHGYGNGVTGPVWVMKKVDFGQITEAVTPQKVKCYTHIHWSENGVNIYDYGKCLLLSTEGNMYLWGRYSAWWTANKVFPFQVTVGGVNHRISDFAMSWKRDYNNRHTYCAISMTDEKTYCTGFCDNGQCGDGTLINRCDPNGLIDTNWQPVASNVKFAKIYAGYQFFMAIDYDGKVYSWGRDQGYDNLQRTPDALNPNNKPGLIDPSKKGFIASSICIQDHGCGGVLINEKGEPYLFGGVGQSSYTTYSEPYLMSVFQGKKVVSCSATPYAVHLIFSDNTIYSIGQNDHNELYMNSDTTYVNFFTQTSFPIF
ncbi:hypothetical protein C9374_003928 [Naegleria lovaniensis]|uniref:Uncharacterized protein n=1 Tax=Naegleria lovaniensis TaxID=51637 RepID=A0AA88KT45_NAELO|nr:uncharacterized protein C9374_003928 [Naegleria lovaniensis]KAG2394164.1 hypothetical protein C9374_003928 [Naegleria lovaniensis]